MASAARMSSAGMAAAVSTAMALSPGNDGESGEDEHRGDAGGFHRAGLKKA
jgi:hypothetical protein